MTSEEAADLIKWKERAEKAERERDELRCELGAIRESTKLAEAARDALAAALTHMLKGIHGGGLNCPGCITALQTLDQHAPGWRGQ